jgi:hypothetical protein
MAAVQQVNQNDTHSTQNPIKKKAAYIAPELHVLGPAKDLTAGNEQAPNCDAGLPAQIRGDDPCS